MRGALIVIPVGTSLLSNDGGHRSTAELNDYRHKQDAAWDYPNESAVAPLLQVLWRDLIAGGALARELGHRRAPTGSTSGRSGPRDALPQELSYLALLPHSRVELLWDPKPKVALLASHSAEGKLCAKVLFRVLNEHTNDDPWSRYQVLAPLTIEGLRVHADADDCPPGCPDPVFRKHGVPALVQAIQSLCACHAPSQVVVNITGGFKGVIPYTTLAALLLDEPPIALHYLFEDTDRIIELPVYPIGLDFPRWHRQRVLMHAAAQSPGCGYEQQLDPRTQAIVREKHLWSVPGSLPYLLEEQYQRQRDRDPLQLFSEQVIRQLLPSDANGYQSRLLALAGETGSLIWYGDKVPMAAEHAARHHHHLLEIAQLLLTPIACLELGGKPFLNERERFVLLAAVLLHDCGHTVGMLPLGVSATQFVPLFPSEVRDLHHFLAWYRLIDERAPEVRGWDRTAELSREVAWLCLYHRARTGWKGISPDHSRCPYLGVTISPPLEAACAYGLCDAIDLPKLIALLRVIDGLDIQSHRVGPPPSAEVMRATFEHDAQACRARVAQLLPAAQSLLTSASDCPYHSEAVKFCEQLECWLGGRADKPEAKTYARMREGFAELLAAGEGSLPERAAAAACTELARAYDEFSLRDRQYIHFVKHEAVSRVALLPAEDFDDCSTWSFRATFIRNPQLAAAVDDAELGREYASDLGMSPCDGPTVRNWITREIEREISIGIQQYLSERSGRAFYVRVRWDDEDHRRAATCIPRHHHQILAQ